MRGHAAVDRELYVPRSWTSDPERCKAAGLGEDNVFATKPDLACVMIERFLNAGHRVGWVTGDEVYGGDPKLRAALEGRGMGYVLAVACSAEVTTGAGKFRADALARKLPKRAWQKLSAGRGAKGRLFDDWTVINLTGPAPGHRQLLIRRNRTPGELAHYRCHSAGPVPLTPWSRRRLWPSRRPSSPAKAGRTDDTRSPLPVLEPLGHPRHARPRLPRRRPAARTHPTPRPGRTDPADLQRDPALVPRVVVHPLHGLAHRLSWSDWRRRHQGRSRTSY